MVGERFYSRGQVNVKQPLDYVIILPERGMSLSPLSGNGRLVWYNSLLGGVSIVNLLALRPASMEAF